VSLAASGSAELLLLHVLPPPAAYATPDLAGATWIPVQRKVRAAAKARLRGLEQQVMHAHVRAHAVVTEGLPSRQILRVAKRLHCDLIVLATHGRTGILHAVMGSVAENVLRRAPCPVLTVRPPRMQRGV
jgi:universal stress protein A